jgi:DNA polymerase III subunit delta'
MPLVELHGHERLREQLRTAASRGTLPSSLLLHGPRGVGKQRLALWLGQLLLCAGEQPRPCGRCPQCRFSLALTHPDLHWVFPRPRLKDSDPSLEDVRDDYAEAIAERMAANGLYAPPSGSDGIFVATVRAIVRSAAMSPALATRKAFVIGDAERMVSQEGSDQAANAFLKLLEEPPADTSVILTSSEPGALLPTIRSRVIAVRVAPLGDREIKGFLGDPVVGAYLRDQKEKSSLDELALAAGGAPGRILAGSVLREATAQARRLLDAVVSNDAASVYRAAFGQGASRARGSFTDSLNALEVLLHERVRVAASTGNSSIASGTAKALELVERAKEQAASNVNPQLLTIGLLREMSALMR